jgi:hypothetical protein
VSEIIFLVEPASEGGYVARGLGVSIVTEADSLPELRQNVREATECHFNEADLPKLIRLHFVHEEVFPVLAAA